MSYVSASLYIFDIVLSRNMLCKISGFIDKRGRPRLDQNLPRIAMFGTKPVEPTGAPMMQEIRTFESFAIKAF